MEMLCIFPGCVSSRGDVGGSLTRVSHRGLYQVILSWLPYLSPHKAPLPLLPLVSVWQGEILLPFHSSLSKSTNRSRITCKSRWPCRADLLFLSWSRAWKVRRFRRVTLSTVQIEPITLYCQLSWLPGPPVVPTRLIGSSLCVSVDPSGSCVFFVFC